MMGRMITVGVAALLCTATSSASAPGAPTSPTLNVTPVGGILDAPFNVTLKGVSPGARVAIRATRRTKDGTPWTTAGVFQANAAGFVDAARFPSLGGSYRGVSPHGLLCSALPVEPEKLDAYIAGLANNPRQPTSFPDEIVGRTPIEVTASVDGKVVASTMAWRSNAEGTAGEDVAVADGWKGVFFPPAAGVRPGAPVLLLTGSGGGVFRYTAARLASRGHPALAMAMYRYPGLPDSLVNFPIERVRDAASYLAKRAGTERAVVLGVSRGSEAAALAGVHFPQAFSGVILLVPSHVADNGAIGPAAKVTDSAWTLHGKPVPRTELGYTPEDPRIAEQAKTLPGYNGSAMVLDLWNSPAFEAKYGIPYERMKAPILVLGAGQDGVWPSGISAERIKRRMARHGKGHQVEVHVYPTAGHSMVALAFGGTLSTFSYSPTLKGFGASGGEPNGNCEAAFDSFRATLAFLDRLPKRQRRSKP